MGFAHTVQGLGRNLSHQRPWDMKARPDKFAENLTHWAVREWNQMPTTVDVALRLEKVMELLVQAGSTPESILDFKPTKEDHDQQTRRERMVDFSELPAQSPERSASRQGDLLVLP